jgi:hypothetical protein
MTFLGRYLRLGIRVAAVAILAGCLPGIYAQVSPGASSRAFAKPSSSAPYPKDGKLQDGVYRNPYFGFSYKLPYGWVDRTSEMSAGAEPGKSMVLLSAFERPPQATGESVNSAVVIAAESVSSYPGLKSAAEYFGPLTELTTSKGFKVVNQPYDFSVGAKMVVRADFSKDLSSRSIRQSTLVVLEKSYVISFTFIAGSQDDVDQLLGNLSLTQKK